MVAGSGEAVAEDSEAVVAVGADSNMEAVMVAAVASSRMRKTGALYSR